MRTNNVDTTKRKLLTLLADDPGSETESSLTRTTAEREDFKLKLDLLYRVSKKAGSVSEVSKLLDQILGMAQRTLRASASSALLIDEGRGDFYFVVARGKAGSVLRQVRLGLDLGIAGWVASHAKPTFSNDVTGDSRFNSEIDKITGFTTKSVLAAPLVSENGVIGVLEVLNKIDESGFSEQDLEVLKVLSGTAAIAISNARLHQAVTDGYKSTVHALVAAIDAKDPYTCGHSQRVMEYALMGASALSLSQEEMQFIEFGGLLHDIGKIGINDFILYKPGSLTKEEWIVMHQHPVVGASILREILFLEPARDIVLHHHERYDGNGYPSRLKGEDIPVGARLLAVADAFDTITTNRSYRVAQGIQAALDELYRRAGTQFCPIAVEAFTSGFRANGNNLLPDSVI